MDNYHVNREKRINKIFGYFKRREERKRDNKQMGNTKQMVLINPAVSVIKVNIIGPNTF